MMPRLSTLLAGTLALAACTAWAAGEPAPPPGELEARAFRAALARVAPCIVTIEVHGGVAPPTPKQPRGRRRRRRSIGPVAKAGEGPTTGLIISPEGHIITSTFNFLRQPPVITVTLRDGSVHLARLLGRDDTRKLCLLKIDGVRGLPVPAVAPRDRLRVGQWAIALGLGYGGGQPALSAGILSALSRIFGKAVQTDANISPANYGGPLVDIEGRVIGICTPLSPRHGAYADGVAWYDSGVGFAIPLDGLDPVIQQMKAGKNIQPGRLGIRPAARPAKGGGVAVQSVQKGSAAEKAGIRAGDVIVALDGQAIGELADLLLALGRRVAGDVVEVKLRRKEGELVVRATLAAGQDTQPRPVPRVRRPGGSPP